MAKHKHKKTNKRAGSTSEGGRNARTVGVVGTVVKSMLKKFSKKKKKNKKTSKK